MADKINAVLLIEELAATKKCKAAFFDDLGLCMFKGMGVRSFFERVNAEFPDFERVPLQHALRDDGTLHTDVRLYLYAAVHALHEGRRAPLLKDAGIDPVYHQFIKSVLNKESDTYALLWSFAEEGRPRMDLGRFQRTTAAVVSSADIQTYVRKFVCKKFRFLTASGVVTHEEVTFELVLAALYALTRAYPQWSDMGHLHAIAKTAIHNTGQNLIKLHTSSKRSHLQRNGNTNDYRAVGISMNMDGGSLEHLQAEYSGSMTTTQPEDGVYVTLAKVAKFDSLASWQRSYLKLITADADEGFAEHMAGRDVDDCRHQYSFDRFSRYACRYLKIDPEAAHEFLRSLRPLL